LSEVTEKNIQLNTPSAPLNKSAEIALVIEHNLLREGIKQLLEEYKDMSVVAMARDGQKAVDIVRQYDPDVVLMDADLPGMGGLDTARKIIRVERRTKIIVLDSSPNSPFASRFVDLGVSGYLLRTDSIPKVVEVIRSVCAGKRHITDQVAQVLALKKIDPNRKSLVDALTERELQIMMMTIRGLSSEDIADQLFLEVKTVHSHRYRMLKKLGVDNEVGLTHFALREGLLA